MLKSNETNLITQLEMKLNIHKKVVDILENKNLLLIVAMGGLKMNAIIDAYKWMRWRQDYRIAGKFSFQKYQR